MGSGGLIVIGIRMGILFVSKGEAVVVGLTLCSEAQWLEAQR